MVAPLDVWRSRIRCRGDPRESPHHLALANPEHDALGTDSPSFRTHVFFVPRLRTDKPVAITHSDSVTPRTVVVAEPHTLDWSVEIARDQHLRRTKSFYYFAQSNEKLFELRKSSIGEKVNPYDNKVKTS